MELFLDGSFVVSQSHDGNNCVRPKTGPKLSLRKTWIFYSSKNSRFLLMNRYETGVLLFIDCAKTYPKHLNHFIKFSALLLKCYHLFWSRFMEQLYFFSCFFSPYFLAPLTGQVLKAWDIGVLSMQRGEVSVLLCKPEYAYGSAGNPAKIPPNASVVFEVGYDAPAQPFVSCSNCASPWGTVSSALWSQN